MASPSPLFPIATARLRLRPASFALVIALPFTNERRSRSERRHDRPDVADSEAAARLPWCVARMWCGPIVGTDFLANVAAVDVTADRCTMRFRNRRPQLDRQIRQASIRVEDARFDERSRWTRLEAARAAAALFEPLRIGLERQCADDLTQEQPRSDFAVDQARVLPDPAEPRVLRVHALLHRACVHIGSPVEWRITRRLHPRQQRIEPRLDDE